MSHSDVLLEKIQKKEATIAIIGLGSVGLSFCNLFGKIGFRLIGYDINLDKVKRLQKKEYPFHDSLDSKKYIDKLIDTKQLLITHQSHEIVNADIIVICINTSLDLHHKPNLTNMYNAFRLVSRTLKKGQLVILESTTYPGTTEEFLLPMLEKDNIKVGKDFFLGFVPETINFGEPKYEPRILTRIISGITENCRNIIAKLYQQTGCPIYITTNPKVAEGAKLLQNAFRLINISFINEMKMMFDNINVNIWDVIKAASFKPFGFTPFYPGPGIGGDCIPVDPLYLIWWADQFDGSTQLLELARHINDSMPNYVIQKLITGLSRQKKALNEASILILGVGYKKDVNIATNSAAFKVISLAKENDAIVSYHDPFIPEITSPARKWHLKAIDFDYQKLKTYDAVIIVTSHSFYNWQLIADNSQLIVDTQNVMENFNLPEKKIIRA